MLLFCCTFRARFFKPSTLHPLPLRQPTTYHHHTYNTIIHLKTCRHDFDQRVGRARPPSPVNQSRPLGPSAIAVCVGRNELPPPHMLYTYKCALQLQYISATPAEIRTFHSREPQIDPHSHKGNRYAKNAEKKGPFLVLEKKIKRITLLICSRVRSSAAR